MMLLQPLRTLRTLQRDFKQGRIEFSHEIPVDLPGNVTWGLLADAILDSRKSPIWPRQLEEVRSIGLTKDSILHSRYRFLGLSKEIRYAILFCDSDEMRFSYQPIENTHLHGRVTVDVCPEGNSRCRIVWSGHYFFSGLCAEALFFRLYFEDRFFTTLQKNFNRFTRQSRDRFALARRTRRLRKRRAAS